MKIAYEALYYKAVEEIQRIELLNYRLIEEKHELRRKVEYYKVMSVGIAILSTIICIVLTYWLVK